MRQFRCPQCHNDYEAAMDDYIAIYFNVSPQICAIRYHRPETLEPFDYMFHYRGVREGRRPDGAPYIDSHPRGAARRSSSWSPGLRPASRSTPRRAWSPASAPTPRPASRCRSTGAPVSRDPHGPADLSRRSYEPAERRWRPGPVRLEIANPTAQPGRRGGACSSRRRRTTSLLTLRPLPHRQAPAHQPDLQEPVPLRGGRRRAGARDPRHRHPVHRHQGLDRPLPADRRPQRLRAGAAAFRLAARGDRRAMAARW